MQERNIGEFACLERSLSEEDRVVLLCSPATGSRLADAAYSLL